LANDHSFFHENIARKKKEKQKEDSFLLHRHDKHRRAHAFYVRRHKPMNAADREYLRVTCSRTMVVESHRLIVLSVECPADSFTGGVSR
jgi:hypothetical protein